MAKVHKLNLTSTDFERILVSLKYYVANEKPNDPKYQALLIYIERAHLFHSASPAEIQYLKQAFKEEKQKARETIGNK